MFDSGFQREIVPDSVRDQAPKKHDFAWWRLGQRELEGDFAHLAARVSAQSTGGGSAELNQVGKG